MAINERLFWAHVSTGAECWEWSGAKTSDGYGSYSRGQIAHRIAYELAVGPISEGLEIDHLCRNRSCQRPGHLEPVTHEENMRRRVEAQTRCKNGHEFTAENTYAEQRNGWNLRKCRACNRASVARYKERRNAR